jgi:glutathione synthase
MKKLQEFIAHEKNLMPLCNNNAKLVESLRDVFAKFLKVDTEENLNEVLSNSGDYVLKPQREGGGNNFYNGDIK